MLVASFKEKPHKSFWESVNPLALGAKLLTLVLDKAINKLFLVGIKSNGERTNSSPRFKFYIIRFQFCKTGKNIRFNILILSLLRLVRTHSHLSIRDLLSP